VPVPRASPAASHTPDANDIPEPRPTGATLATFECPSSDAVDSTADNGGRSAGVAATAPMDNACSTALLTAAQPFGDEPGAAALLTTAPEPSVAMVRDLADPRDRHHPSLAHPSLAACRTRPPSPGCGDALPALAGRLGRASGRCRRRSSTRSRRPDASLVADVHESLLPPASQRGREGGEARKPQSASLKPMGYIASCAGLQARTLGPPTWRPSTGPTFPAT
jgi:hypothetical protein